VATRARIGVRADLTVSAVISCRCHLAGGRGPQTAPACRVQDVARAVVSMTSVTTAGCEISDRCGEVR
jgi:hypothetical protein